jgi:hypothetical protein
VNLERFTTQAQALRSSKTWLRVWDAIESGVMPPGTQPRPELEETRRVLDWIESDFLPALAAEGHRPQPISIRRLNRQEYNHTIRDLLGVDQDLAKDFPADEISFGYDNIGSALSISPIHIEKYLLAAERAAALALAVPDVGDRPPVELIGLTTYPLAETGSVTFEHHLEPGRYMVDFSLVRVGVAETVPTPTLQVRFGQDHRIVDAVRVQDETLVYRFWIQVVDGDDKVTVKLADRQTTPLASDAKREVTANVSGDQRYGGNRGLHVDSMVVRGPASFHRDRLPASHRGIVFCEPDLNDASRLECGKKVLSRLVEQAFRRPISEADLAPILAIFERALMRGESFERGLQIATTMILVSPKFLFHVQPDPATLAGDPLAGDPLASDQVAMLGEFVLANRLSYFLWNSMPDESLYRAARSGHLRTTLDDQVRRMLADSKSQAFIEGFTGQWLQLRKLSDARPDPHLFQGIDEGLLVDMRRETEALVGHVVRDNRSILEFLDSDYTFVSDRLAAHYGLPLVQTDSNAAVTRRSLEGNRRGGLLTQASILTLTSNPNRTSPVKRGSWILEHLLGTPPPPPPPNVPSLEANPVAADAVTLREKLELHRANPECAACHNQMDPLGFALENYDAVGRWRDFDGSSPVDTRGTLVGERAFSDAAELKRLLAATESKRFSRCLIENLLTYALGRGLEATDYGVVESIRNDLVRDGYRAHRILLGIVASPQFQVAIP